MEIVGIEPDYFDSNPFPIPSNLIFKILSGDRIKCITFSICKIKFTNLLL